MIIKGLKGNKLAVMNLFIQHLLLQSSVYSRHRPKELSLPPLRLVGESDTKKLTTCFCNFDYLIAA